MTDTEIGTKRPRVEEQPLEVLVFADASEPSEPVMYVKAFDELSPKQQSRMRNQHCSFHEIDEEKIERWDERVSELLEHSMPMTEWMADPVRRRRPLLIVSSFTYGQL